MSDDAVTQGDNQLVTQAGAPTLFPELMDYIKSVASDDRPRKYEYEPGKFTESSSTEAIRMAIGSREAAAHYDKALAWLQSNRDQFVLRARPQTLNYVIFDPSNLRIVGQNGQRLEPIDHDPFAEGTP